MNDYSFYSLVPAITTIAISVATHNVSLALALGIFSGVLVIAGASAALIYEKTIHYAIATFADAERIEISLFVMLIGGLLEIMSASGAYYMLADTLSRSLDSAKKSRVATWLIGVFIFFDDYANVLIAGSSMRKINKINGASIAQVGYIVDIVSEIASVAIISTWAAYEGSIMLESSLKFNLNKGSIELLIESLPYHFYTYLGIIFAFFTAVSGKWLGTRFESPDAGKDEPLSAEEIDPHVRTHHFLTPVLSLIAAAFSGLLISGYVRFRQKSEDAATLLNILSNAPTIEVLLVSAVIATLLCVWIMKKDGVLAGRSYFRIFLTGKLGMSHAALIIMLSNGLAKISADLGTGTYITSIAGGFITAWALPAVIFIASSLITVATGFSWSSMAIMMPVAYQMAVTHSGTALIPVLSGAVVSGAISGAHLVPYSDKSVMTAAACKITTVYHVRTQFLNVICAIAASTAGYLIAGATSSYLLGFLAAAAIISLAHYSFAK
jgi:Na+/H+ antiporter NhaC